MVTGSARTIYIPGGSEEHWKRYLELCTTKLGMSGSKRLAKLWMEDLAKLEGSEKSGFFNYEQKLTAKNAAKKKELELQGLLERQIIPGNRQGNNNNKYQELFEFTINLGTDEGLEKNLPEVRSKLLRYKLNGTEPFSRSDRQTFVLYLGYVMLRRKLEAEIEQYLLSNNFAENENVPAEEESTEEESNSEVSEPST